nr:stalk domain-containing protein [Thermoclostridium stercorarium]
MLKNAVKKFIGILLIFLVIIAFPFHVTAQKSTEGPEIRVYVNDTEVAVDVPPFFVKSFTLVPVRAVFEALGAKVQWTILQKRWLLQGEMRFVSSPETVLRW